MPSILRRSRLPLVALLAALLTAAAGPAHAAPQVDGVFDLPGVATNSQLTVGPDGERLGRARAGRRPRQPLGVGDRPAGRRPGRHDRLPHRRDHVGRRVHLGQPDARRRQGGPGEDPARRIRRPPPASRAPASPRAARPSPRDRTGTSGSRPPGRSRRSRRATRRARPPTRSPGSTPKAMTASGDGTLWVTDTGNGGRLLNVTTAGAVTPYAVGGAAAVPRGARRAGRSSSAIPTTPRSRSRASCRAACRSRSTGRAAATRSAWRTARTARSGSPSSPGTGWRA